MLDFAQKYRNNLLVCLVLVLVTGTVSAINMQNYPMRFEDEGTYISQAWAVQHLKALTHYTYWYDHPPLGWLQIAGWTSLTSAFERYSESITAGREFMAVLKVISSVLVYILALRLGLRHFFAVLAALLFALSPLSVEFGRYVLLDNVAIPWLLLAFIFALSPKKHILAYAGSAACMALAVLSKETILILLPALLLALWQNSDKRNRRFGYMVFSGILVMLGGAYLLYAAVKNELLEGEGHVSLVGAIKWQLFDRQATGSIFDPSSGSSGLLGMWLGIDPWLIGFSLACLPFAFYFRSLRPVALALAIQFAMMLRPGYLPFPYIIAILPFAALVFAGTADKLLTPLRDVWREQARAGALIIAAALFFHFAIPHWFNKLSYQMSNDADYSGRQTVSWIKENIPRDSRLIVDSYIWLDVVRLGFTNPKAVWTYKTETDPAIKRELGDWQNIDYLVMAASTLDPRHSKDFPTIFKVKENSKEVASFGKDNDKIVIMQLNKKSESSESD